MILENTKTYTIGQRDAYLLEKAAKEENKRGYQKAKEMGIDTTVYYSWRKRNVAPSAYYLQQMAFAGYDVYWILTGGKNEN